MWKKNKQKISKLVMFSVKNHWLVLLVLLVMQYVTGNALVKGGAGFPLNGRQIFLLHSWVGKLLLLSVAVLTLEKIYLLLLRKGKL